MDMDKLVEVDAQYREWISEVSKRFHQSQIKAAVKVNDEMLRFYWQLGKELHDRKDKFSYGQSFYKTCHSWIIFIQSGCFFSSMRGSIPLRT